MVVGKHKEAHEAYQLILDYFNHDVPKTIAWFTTKNFLIGNITPKSMIEHGRAKKLLEFIKSQLEGNFR